MKKIIIIISMLFVIVGCQKESHIPTQVELNAALADAIKTNDIEKLKNLKLNKGINEYYNSRTPLFYATELNNIEAVKYFIEQGADVNKDGVLCGPKVKWLECVLKNKPLHIAVRESYADITKILIENGADVNMENTLEQTPLFIAAQNGNKEIVEILKSAGVEYDIFSAIMMQELPTIKTLIKNGADLNKKKLVSLNKVGKMETPLSLAEQTGNAEIIELLKSAGAK